MPSSITLAMMREHYYSAVQCGALDSMGLRNQSPRAPLLPVTGCALRSPYDSVHRQRVIDLDVPVEIAGVVVCPQEAEAEAVRRAWVKVHAESVTRDAIRAGMKATEAYAKYGVL